MEKFIKPVDLLSELCSIAETAEKEIYIVCPFVLLHHNFKRALKKQQSKKNLSIIFIYGKFSNNEHYKLNKADLEFLKGFQNIKIIYHAKLHAKFYANEKTALVTSLNLNHNSSNNNIEYGIRLDGEDHILTRQIKDFIKDIIAEAEVVFDSQTIEQVNAKSNQNTDSIANIKQKHPNAYEKWVFEDDEKLEILFCEKKSIPELAKIFKRQQGAIRSRIKKLELSEKYGL
jgi:phosphatidylserine/phosphatidylglycerophosphate/cardiolipin synthase-like enzyme